MARSHATHFVLCCSSDRLDYGIPKLKVRKVDITKMASMGIYSAQAQKDGFYYALDLDYNLTIALDSSQVEPFIKAITDKLDER